MRLSMSLQSRRELIKSTSSRYKSSSKSDKTKILDEFCAAAGYNRKYASGILNSAPAVRQKLLKRKRIPRFTAVEIELLKKVWNLSDRLCGKRLAPALPILLEALVRHEEISLCPDKLLRLSKISASTLDRLLAPVKRNMQWRGKTTTKPGTLLKHQIPIRTFADWDNDSPGFFEADLVAHCGESMSGEFAYTLTMTDVSTGWTETAPLPNRSQVVVCEGIDRIRQRLPFKIKGIDSDNGSEFINFHLLHYCEENKITFTRCRPYKKNDQCYVEGKNWSVVRQNTGYARYEGEEAVVKLKNVYSWLRLQVNYFQPSQKLISKSREGAKLSRRHDAAKTPYQRLLDSNRLTADEEREVREYYTRLNPALINRSLTKARAALTDSAKVRLLTEAT